MQEIKLLDIGLKNYTEAWDFQNKLHQEIIDVKLQNRKLENKLSHPNYFIFTEHPHVYTLGKSGEMSNLLLNETQFEAKRIQFVKSNRV